MVTPRLRRETGDGETRVAPVPEPDPGAAGPAGMTERLTRQCVDLLVRKAARHDDDGDREGGGGATAQGRDQGARAFLAAAGAEHQEGDVLVLLNQLHDLVRPGADADDLLGLDARS